MGDKDELRDARWAEVHRAGVESALIVGNWRTEANKLYLAVSTSLAAVLGWLVKEKAPPGSSVGVAILGVVVCVYWSLALARFRVLAKAKYDALIELEDTGPFAFFARDRALSSTGWLNSSAVEQGLSVTFAASFVVVALDGFGVVDVL